MQSAKSAPLGQFRPSCFEIQDAYNEEVMSLLAEGSFEVTLTPVSASDEPYARMSIKKSYQGPLEGIGAGEMMTGGVPEAECRVYVALETVEGTLDGREGSFILVHRGTMAPDARNLEVTVVPGSGQRELAGILGEMQIDVEDGKHLYTFRYELPSATSE